MCDHIFGCRESVDTLLHLHAHAVGHDDRIIDQHTQCYDQGTQGDALQNDALHFHDDEGTHDRDQQDRTDDSSAAQTHEQHQYKDYDDDGFSEVDQESIDRFGDGPGL